MTEPEFTTEDIDLEEAKRLAAVPPERIPDTAHLPDEVPDGPVLSSRDEAPDEPTLPRED